LSVALGYFENFQIEVILPQSGDCDIYRDILHCADFSIRLHHFGYLLYDEVEFEDMKAAYAARGAPTVIEGANPRSGNRYFYADTRAEFGHYTEYVYLTEQGQKDYAAIARNV
jgi:hypothetical protein